MFDIHFSLVALQMWGGILGGRQEDVTEGLRSNLSSTPPRDCLGISLLLVTFKTQVKSLALFAVAKPSELPSV